MKYKFERTEKIEKLFNRRKVVTIDDLKNTLDTSFSKTVFRYLQGIGYLSSYNYAGKFYTIPNIPKFDEYGLWRYEMASFSKFGTLKSTMCALIKGSQDGYTHRELKQLLRCRVQNTLNDLLKNNTVSRELVKGLSVYVDASKEKAVIQISQRNNKSGIGKIQGKAIKLPTIVAILLELLRSAVWDVKTISKNLNAGKIFVTEQQIKEVMRHYDLKKKL